MRRSPIKGVVISRNLPVPDEALRLTVSFKVYPMLYALPVLRSRANCVGGCAMRCARQRLDSLKAWNENCGSSGRKERLTKGGRTF